MQDALAVVKALERNHPISVVDHPTSEDSQLEMIDVNGDRQINLTDAMQVIIGLLNQTSAAPTAIALGVAKQLMSGLGLILVAGL
jgi:hypothetical protein